MTDAQRSPWAVFLIFLRLGLLALVVLMFWRLPPWLVVLCGGLLGGLWMSGSKPQPSP